MPDDLAKLTAEQGGAFTRSQALASGLSSAQIRTALRRGRWLAPARGIYVTTTSWEDTAGDPRARHVLRAAARVLACQLGAVASHRAGALVHGLPLLGGPPDQPQLTRAPRFPGDTSADGHLYVAGLPEGTVATVGGVPVTALARTACDVARTTPLRSGLVTADAVLRRGVTREDLLGTAGAYADWPGGRRAAQVAGSASGRSETVLESITRLAYVEEGLPAPEEQVEIRDPHGRLLGIVDFLWRAQRTVGEADGMTKYDRAGALRQEKLREEQIRACGLEVVRNTWDDAWHPGRRKELGRRVWQAFSFAAARPLADGVTFRTPSLDELIRRDQALPDRVAS